MNGSSAATALMLVLGPVVVGTLLLAFGRNDRPRPLDESRDWCRTTAEVLSVWGPRDRRFVLVRYRVGASLIENDVPHPPGHATLQAGQRVHVKYHPMHPAQVVLDAARPADAPRSSGSGLAPAE